MAWKSPMKMQIDFLAGLNLRLSSPGGSAFHAKHRPQRRLARRNDRPAANALQPLREPDGGHGLPFTGSRRRGGRYQDELASARKRRIRKNIQLQLGAVASNGLKVIFRKFQFCQRWFELAAWFDSIWFES